jgi:hypothetical protein
MAFVQGIGLFTGFKGRDIGCCKAGGQGLGFRIGDRDPLSFFSAQLSQLLLFDQPLSETQVAALYADYAKQALLYPRGAAGERQGSEQGLGFCRLRHLDTSFTAAADASNAPSPVGPLG